jgi:hypothetical protein
VSVHAKNRLRKRKVAMLTPAMLCRLLLALAALSLVRAFAVEGYAMAEPHLAARSKAATYVANEWIYG